jgi:DNA-binding GntR family transcriptional regulator
LTTAFTLLIAACAPNRFITDFHGIIALIFHYHYQWNRRTELARNRVALHEHMAIIDALQSRDANRAEAATIAHLNTARTTLLQARLRNTPLGPPV